MRSTFPLLFGMLNGFIAVSILCPVPGWTADSQRGIKVEADRPLVLSGRQGEVRSDSPSDQPTERGLQFGETLRFGEQIRTGPQSRAEILIGHQEVVTLEEKSSVRITTDETNGSPVIDIQNGTVRLAVAASQLAAQEQVSLRTPFTRAVTRGGVFRVTMGGEARRAEVPLGGDKASVILAAYSSPTAKAEIQDSAVRYQVEEGLLMVEINGQSVQVKAGETVEVSSGQIGVPFATPDGLRGQYPLTALAHHQDTPKSGLAYLASQELKQAEVLGEVLGGVAAQTQEPEKQEKAEQEVILATTGVSLSGGGSTLPTSLPPLGESFSVAQEVGGPTSSLIDPASNDSFNVVIGPAGPNIAQPKGGGGLLLFDNSQITLDAQTNNRNFRILFDLEGTAKFRPFNTELMLIDGGTSSFVPHQGVLPTERLTVTNLFGGQVSNPVDPPPGRNLLLPFPIASFNDPAEIEAAASQAKVLTRFSDPADKVLALNVLATFASSQQVIPGFTSESILFQRRFTDDGCCSNEEAVEGVNGVIRTRDLPGGDPLTVTGGVVLNNQTDLVATTTKATAEYFQQPDDIDSSIVALLGRNFDVRVLDQFPEDGQLDPFTNNIGGIDEVIPDFIEVIPEIEGGGQANPAHVILQDRVLAVLDGSTIAPDKSDPFNIPRVSLLTILDSRLEGPTAPPDLIPGDLQPVATEGSSPIPIGKSRADIPPLIEIINSGTPNLDPSDPGFEMAVEAHSAFVIRGELAPSILEASGPLVSLFQGTMTTSGDFVNVQGNGTADSAQLMASLQQSNVLQGALQLNNSQLQVGGHLFNFLNGATGQVTGNLTALANDSILSVNGALLSVGLNSSFTLTGGSLVAFGFGTNTVNITGTSGTCAGCNLSTTVPNLTGIPVLLHPSATVAVGNGFIPYAGVGQGTIGATDFNNAVNVSAGAAVLQVDQGGTLVLNP